MAVSNYLQNLLLDIQGGTGGTQPGSTSPERIITIDNQGAKDANIELWIETADLRSQALQRWALFEPSDSKLKIESKGRIEVKLSFRIPFQAEPGFYGYDVRVRSPQYPGEEIRRSQQLKVEISTREVLQKEPKVRLMPSTNSFNPYKIEIGKEAVFTISLDNPSRRTDRFFLTCSDLPESWFTIKYETNNDGSALLGQTDGLELNPRAEGKIELRIHPPKYVAASIYSPTIRITSSNHSYLVILETIYFAILVDSTLKVKLSPEKIRIPSKERNSFEIYVENLGNVNRELLITATDTEQAFVYPIESSEIKLPPGSNSKFHIRPRPRYPRRQLWRRKQRVIDFRVDIYNISVKSGMKHITEGKELVTSTLPSLEIPTDLPEGSIIWAAKRRWLFWMVMIGLPVSGIIITAVLLWRSLVWHPSFIPKIEAFASDRTDYQEGTEQGVTFSWRISNPNRIETVKLLRSDKPEIEEKFKFLAQGLKFPRELELFCQLQKTPQNNTFVSILLRLNKSMIGVATNDEVLICRGVPLNSFISVEGNYKFQLQVFSKKSQQSPILVSDQRETDNIVVAPPALPQILEFGSDSNLYSAVPENIRREDELASSKDRLKLNSNVEADNTDIHHTRSSQKEIKDQSILPIRLNWDISNFSNIQALKVVSLSSEGLEIAPVEVIRLPEITDNHSLDEVSFPESLDSHCNLEEQTLKCRNFPTTITKAGRYIFQLIVVPRRDLGNNTISRRTAIVPVLPPAPKILRFSLNGESSRSRPKHVFVLNPERGFLDIIFSWEVENADKVELLPAPGVVEGNSLSYTISTAPGIEIVQLRAVNELGEEVTQSISIEKISSADLSNPTNPSITGSESGGVLPAVPTSPDLSDSSPSKLPPAQESPIAN